MCVVSILLNLFTNCIYLMSKHYVKKDNRLSIKTAVDQSHGYVWKIIKY